MQPQLTRVPAGGYPSIFFFGAPPSNPGAGNASDSSVQPVSSQHVLIVVGAIVAIGFLAFYLNER